MGKGNGKGGVNWDETLAYNTIKYIRIKNAFVGALHYFFMLLIMAYLVGYIFIVEKKYLHIDNPVAQLRFATMGPCQPTTAAGLCKIASHTKKIKAVGETCQRAFQCDEHPYCANKPGAKISSLANGKMPCVYWDHNSVTWPPSEKNALTLATRASIYDQKLELPNGQHCGPPKGKGLAQTNYNCQWSPSVVSGKSYDTYIADIGNYTISVNQVVSATVLPIEVTSMRMKGELLRCKEGALCRYELINNFESVKTFEPTKANNGNAVVTVDEILSAVVPASHTGLPKAKKGLNLDEVNTGCPDKCVQYSTGKHLLQSNRWTGFVIIFDIQYDNTGLLIPESGPNDVRFRLRAYAVPEATFRVEVPFLQSNNTRVIHHLHGMRIVTMTKGNLGQFSWNTVLIQLTTSITLIFISTTIVDMIITRCMVNKDYYTAIKYQDDDDAINFVKDPEERAALQAQHDAAEVGSGGGLDWKAILTFGMASTAPPVSLPKPHTGSGTGSYSSLATDEATPLVGASSPPVEETSAPALPVSGPRSAHSGGGCCRPARDANDQV
jgi:hypothetical protein